MAEEDSVRDPGCGRHRGRWSHRACPRGSQKGTSMEVEGSAGGSGQMSLGEPAAHSCGRPGRGGTRAYSASLTAGLWEPAGGWRPRGRKGHTVCSWAGPWVSLLWPSSSTWPCPSPRMGAFTVLGRSWAGQSGRLATLARQASLILTPALPGTPVAEAPFFSVSTPPQPLSAPEVHRLNSPRPGST